MGIIKVISGKLPATVKDSLDLLVLGDVFTVTFQDAAIFGNTILKIETVLDGGTAFAPSTVHPGYVFTGWSLDFSNVTADIITVAEYYPIYTVYFVDHDGSLLKSEVVNSGEDATPPANPSRIYYTFEGWSGVYTNVTSSRVITATYQVLLSAYSLSTTNTTLNYGDSAALSVVKADAGLPNIISYSWSLSAIDIGNGTLTNTTSAVATLENTNITAITDTGSFGCTITTSDGTSGALPNVGITLIFAQFLVEFRDYDGTVLQTETVLYGTTTVTAPAEPTRIYYNFDRWSTAFDDIRSDTIIIAIYKVILSNYIINPITIDLNYLGTANFNILKADLGLPSIISYSWTTVNLVLTNRTLSSTTASIVTLGNTNTSSVVDNGFLSCEIETSDGAIGTLATVPVTLQKAQFTVTFDSYLSSVDVIVDYNGNATAPTPGVKPYYNFDVWVGSYSGVTSDRTITATYLFDILSYTILVGNTNLGYPGSTTLTTNTLSAGLPTITSYSWSTSSIDLANRNLIDANTASATLINTNTSSAIDTGFVECYVNLSDGSFGSLTPVAISIAQSQFTVTFNSFGLSVDVVVNEGDDAIAPTPGVQTHYDFLNWSGVYTNVTSDRIITAIYRVQISSYSISIVDATLNYGESTNASIVKAIPTLPDIVTFSWYTNSFTVGTYSLSFATSSEPLLNNINRSSSTSTGTIGCSITTTDGASGAINSSLINLYRARFTVTFEDYDGSFLYSEIVDYNGSATPPASPTRTYYDFNGWSDSYELVTTTRTITATYLANMSGYSISITDATLNYNQSVDFAIVKAESGLPNISSYSWYTSNLISSNYSLIDNFSATPSLLNTNEGTATDYGSVGCSITTSEGVSGSLSDVSITLYRARFTVTFNSEGSSVDVVVNYGADATAPTPGTKLYYDFDYWSGTYTNVTSDRTITAIYQVNMSGYSISIGDTTLDYGQTITGTIIKAIPSLPNITSYSWYTSSFTVSTATLTFATEPESLLENVNRGTATSTGTLSCSIVAADGGSGSLTSSTIYLYQARFKVIFNSEGSSVNVYVNYGEDATPPTPGIKTGYILDYWSGTYTNVTSDRTITAVYKVDTSQLTCPSITSGTTSTYIAQWTFTSSNVVPVDVNYTIWNAIQGNETVVRSGSFSLSTTGSFSQLNPSTTTDAPYGITYNVKYGTYLICSTTTVDHIVITSPQPTTEQ